MKFSKLLLLSNLLMTCIVHKINCMNEENKSLIQSKQQTYGTSNGLTGIASKVQVKLKDYLDPRNKKIEEKKEQEKWDEAVEKGIGKFYVEWFNEVAKSKGDDLRLGWGGNSITKIYELENSNRVFKFDSISIGQDKIMLKLFNKEKIAEEELELMYDKSLRYFVKLRNKKKEVKRAEAACGLFCCILPHICLDSFAACCSFFCNIPCLCVDGCRDIIDSQSNGEDYYNNLTVTVENIE